MLDGVTLMVLGAVVGADVCIAMVCTDVVVVGALQKAGRKSKGAGVSVLGDVLCAGVVAGFGAGPWVRCCCCCLILWNFLICVARALLNAL